MANLDNDKDLSFDPLIDAVLDALNQSNADCPNDDEHVSLIMRGVRALQPAFWSARRHVAVDDALRYHAHVLEQPTLQLAASSAGATRGIDFGNACDVGGVEQHAATALRTMASAYRVYRHLSAARSLLSWCGFGSSLLLGATRGGWLASSALQFFARRYFGLSAASAQAGAHAGGGVCEQLLVHGRCCHDASLPKSEPGRWFWLAFGVAMGVALSSEARWWLSDRHRCAVAAQDARSAADALRRLKTSCVEPEPANNTVPDSSHQCNTTEQAQTSSTSVCSGQSQKEDAAVQDDNSNATPLPAEHQSHHVQRHRRRKKH